MSRAPAQPSLAWSPDSWRPLPALQQPTWPDRAALERTLAELHKLPPLIFAAEAEALTRSLAQAAAGRAFVLQAGDCAETFEAFSTESVRNKLQVILQMAVVLTYGAGLPVVKIGRIAGQFAKPRSSDTERVGGLELPSYRGDMVNDVAPSAEARRPDSARLLRAYHQAAATLNALRAWTQGGMADLTQVHAWNQVFVARSSAGERYEALARDIDRALRFMAACGVDLGSGSTLHRVDFYVSHEALLLDYEHALLRREPRSGAWFDTSAHTLWIGERTRQLGGAHVELLRGIHNPVGLKLGPSVSPADALALCERLDPERTPGRLTLVCRMGATKVEAVLPPVVRAVRALGHPVVWACDPMHGNTFTGPSGHKTRRFRDVLEEVRGFFAVLRHEGAQPGGLHVELTGEDVTECLGGAEDILDEHLGRRYETACDPRLNASQSLELAFEVAEMLRQR